MISDEMPLVEAALIRNKALVIVFASNILLHAIVDVSSSNYLFQELSKTTIACLSAVHGLTLLVYPLLGWLADVYLTRYTALKCAPVLSVVGAVTVASGLSILVELWISHDYLHFPTGLVFVGIFLMIVGSGLFEANALQFGLDQLLEAPSDHLSAFIHWYFWGIHFIQTLLYLTHIALVISEHHLVCQLLYNSRDSLYDHLKITGKAEALVCILILFLSACLALLILKWNRSCLEIQPAGTNPFKKVSQVLRYTWNHKIPERRSAFTYWEEDVPARIDVGKEKYGGPFSNEEVEDTKTFLRLLLVILSLFGFQMPNDGYDVMKQLTNDGLCPSLPLLLVIGLNAKFLIQVMVVVGVPLYRLVLLPIFKYNIPRMMRKIWLGSVLSFLQVSAYLIISLVASTRDLRMDKNSLLVCFLNQSYSLNASGFCIPPSSPVFDQLFNGMIIPQVLGGLSYMLVFMTALEFLCAQSPRTMQGMLIGFWYSSGFIKFALIGFTDLLCLGFRPSALPILNVLKVCASFTSLVMYSCVSRRYRYRERDEAVNFQAMIEDQYEREIDQELFHEEEERALLEFTDSCTGYGATLQTF